MVLQAWLVQIRATAMITVMTAVNTTRASVAHCRPKYLRVLRLDQQSSLGKCPLRTCIEAWHVLIAPSTAPLISLSSWYEALWHSVQGFGRGRGRSLMVSSPLNSPSSFSKSRRSQGRWVWKRCDSHLVSNSTYVKLGLGCHMGELIGYQALPTLYKNLGTPPPPNSK